MLWFIFLQPKTANSAEHKRFIHDSTLVKAAAAAAAASNEAVEPLNSLKQPDSPIGRVLSCKVQPSNMAVEWIVYYLCEIIVNLSPKKNIFWGELCG
jgi:hypothetical protein